MTEGGETVPTVPKPLKEVIMDGIQDETIFPAIFTYVTRFYGEPVSAKRVKDNLRKLANEGIIKIEGFGKNRSYRPC